MKSIDAALISRISTALSNAHPANDVEAAEIDSLQKALTELPEAEEQ